MKSVKQQAIELMKEIEEVDNYNQQINAIKQVIRDTDRESRADQDKLTRQACAEAVKNCDISDDRWEWDNIERAEQACINCKSL